MAFASQYGYPLMIKAVSGGGGRGIRQVADEKELLSGLRRSRAEALMSFGDDNIYLEKHVRRPRHVEVQILADTYGNVVHLGTRNCSIQRRHQKLIEIAPAGLAPALTAEICDAAVRVARAANYLSAGTVEFLVDPDDTFYFLEVNTRTAGGAHGHRGGHRYRHRPGAVSDRHGRAHQLHPGPDSGAGLRHRTQDQCRRPQKRLPLQPRGGPDLSLPRRPRGPAGWRHLSGL